MPLYDFECKCGVTVEAVTPSAQQRLRCQCGKMARRVISVGFKSSHLKTTVDNEPAWLHSDNPTHPESGFRNLIPEPQLRDKKFMSNYRTRDDRNRYMKESGCFEIG